MGGMLKIEYSCYLFRVFTRVTRINVVDIRAHIKSEVEDWQKQILALKANGKCGFVESLNSNQTLLIFRLSVYLLRRDSNVTRTYQICLKLP